MIPTALLVHSAWLTSAAFGAANLLLLRDRIRREEQALEEDNGYRESVEVEGNLLNPPLHKLHHLYLALLQIKEEFS